MKKNYHQKANQLVNLLAFLPGDKSLKALKLFEEITEMREEDAKESLINFIWLEKKTSMYKLRSDTHLDTLCKITRAYNESSTMEEFREKILPHLRTIQRFIEENFGPEFTLEDARIELESMIIRKVNSTS